MTLDVGPVAPSSAGVWMEWARGAVADHSHQAASVSCAPPGVIESVDGYLRNGAFRGSHEGGRWHVEVDPDELEYVAAALFHLDPSLTDAPAEARAFHLVLARDVLRCLERECRSRAVFADQLRSSWPNAKGCC